MNEKVCQRCGGVGHLANELECPYLPVPPVHCMDCGSVAVKGVIWHPFHCPQSNLEPKVKITENYRATEFLNNAANTMEERGKQYDSPEGERSMRRTVLAFNTITGQDLTEAQGWLFMSVLKKVRQYQGGAHLDSCVDDVAYSALFAEARMRESHNAS